MKDRESEFEEQLQSIVAVGLPVPQVLVTEMICLGNAPPAVKKVMLDKLSELSAHIKGHGGIRIRFADKTSGQPTEAILYLDECEASHDLGAQLAKLDPRLPDAAARETLRKRRLTELVHFGREAYGMVVSQSGGLMELVGSHLPEDFDARLLHIDPTNTTFYINIPGSRRVGIFIKLE